MKFCPECGRKREEEDVCQCGYDYTTGEVHSSDNPKGNHQSLNNQEIVPCLGAIPLDNLKERKIDTGDLLEVSYTTSGGMMGSYYNDSLSFVNNEITITNQDWHHGDKIEKVYKVDENKAKEIKELLVDNNFRAWSEVAIDYSMIAMDAPSSSMSLRFENLSSSFSTRIYMTDEERNIFFKVREMIGALVDEENLKSERVLYKGQTMVMGMCDTSIGEDNLNSKRFCPECGAVIPDSNPDFCDKCGSKLKK